MSHNTERRAFLVAIRETPADDAPRLIYADWLDEQNEGVRASLIRFQCAGGAGGAAFTPGPERRRELAVAPLPGGLAPRFQRGFVADVDARTPADLGLLGPLARTEPLCDVQHSTESPEFGDWAECEPLLRAEGLLVQRETAAALGFVGVSHRLNCRTLRLNGQPGRPGLTSDVSAPLPRLDGLGFPGSAVPGEVLAWALRLCGGAIRTLWVPHLAYRPSNARRVSRDLSSLEGLSLGEPQGSGPGVLNFALSLDCPDLRLLCIDAADLSHWPAIITSLPWAVGLERLRLTAGHRFAASGPMTVESLEGLGKACPKLRELWLDCASVAGRFEKLFRRKVWPALESLALFDPPAELVRAMACAGLMGGLSRLAIYARREAGVQSGPLLRALASGSRLESLTLSGVAWDRRAARAYLTSPYANELRHLSASPADWAAADLFDLCDAAPAGLEALDLPDRFDSESAAVARKRWGPRVNLYWME